MNSNEWYNVNELSKNVYAFTEDKHAQKVTSFLIVGEKASLLFDTGLGLFPLKPLIDPLVKGELITVNSHFHFDHIGHNARFEPIYCKVDPWSENIAKNGISYDFLKEQLEPIMFIQGPKPKELENLEFNIKPYKTIHLEEGHIFDLGDRSLSVIYTPGHSKDCIMLYDKENKILFTGDTFYMGALYAQFDDPILGKSSIDDYLESMEKVLGIISDDVTLYCSHNEVVVPGSKIKEARDLLLKIKESPASYITEVDPAHQYGQVSKQSCRIYGDGFSIIYEYDLDEYDF